MQHPNTECATCRERHAQIREQEEALRKRREAIEGRASGTTVVRCSRCLEENDVSLTADASTMHCSRCKGELENPRIYEAHLAKEQRRHIRADRDEEEGIDRPDRSPSVASSFASSETGDDVQAVATSPDMDLDKDEDERSLAPTVPSYDVSMAMRT